MTSVHIKRGNLDTDRQCEDDVKRYKEKVTDCLQAKEKGLQ